LTSALFFLWFIGYFEFFKCWQCGILGISRQDKALSLKHKFVFLLKMVVKIQCFKCMLFHFAPQDFVFPDSNAVFNNSFSSQDSWLKNCRILELL